MLAAFNSLIGSVVGRGMARVCFGREVSFADPGRTGSRRGHSWERLEDHLKSRGIAQQLGWLDLLYVSRPGNGRFEGEDWSRIRHFLWCRSMGERWQRLVDYARKLLQNFSEHEEEMFRNGPLNEQRIRAQPVPENAGRRTWWEDLYGNLQALRYNRVLVYFFGAPQMRVVPRGTTPENFFEGRRNLIINRKRELHAIESALQVMIASEALVNLFAHAKREDKWGVSARQLERLLDALLRVQQTMNLAVSHRFELPRFREGWLFESPEQLQLAVKARIDANVETLRSNCAARIDTTIFMPERRQNAERMFRGH